MEYFDYLPPKYLEAFTTLTQEIGDAETPEVEAKLFDDFSQKYTTLSYPWCKRIRLENVGTPDFLSKEVFEKCLNLRIKAFKHFYHPRYIQFRLTDAQERRALDKIPNVGKIYRLPYAKNIWNFFEIYMKQNSGRYASEFLQHILSFPHDQLYRFYRFAQVKSAHFLLDEKIKEKYFAAVESYNYMISIALDSEKWLEWMKKTFEEKDWILNLECKISEHFFLKEIWFFYIEYLKHTIAVLDVYKRYCRLFIEDTDMQQQYSEAIQKYDTNFHTLRWQFDQEEFIWDFETKENGCPKLQQLFENSPNCICKACFNEKNAKYFDNKFNGKSKNGGIFSKFLNNNKNKKDEKIENCLLCYGLLKSDKDDIELKDENEDKMPKKKCKEYKKAINFHPIVKIKFCFYPFWHDHDLPLPLTIFQYIVQNANEKILTKLYWCSKYFFAVRRYLICGSVFVENFSPQFIRKNYFSNVKSLTNLQVKKICCGTNFIFVDDICQTSLSPLISEKLCFCSLINVVLVNQELTVKEFDIIIGGGKLEQIDVDQTVIFNEDESYLVLEDLIEKLPHVAVFASHRTIPQMFTTLTTKKLSKLVRTTKFEHFEIWNIPETFEFVYFIKFLELYMVPRAIVLLHLQHDIDDAFDQMFSHFRSFIHSTWEPMYAAPQINP